MPPSLLWAWVHVSVICVTESYGLCTGESLCTLKPWVSYLYDGDKSGLRAENQTPAKHSGWHINN